MTNDEMMTIAIKGGCVAGDTHLMCSYPGCKCKTTPAIVRAAVIVMDQLRDAEKRRACTHPRKNGSGTIASDGSSRSSWHCLDCGATGESQTPPRSAAIPVQVW